MGFILVDASFHVCSEDFHRTVMGFGEMVWGLGEEGGPDVAGFVVRASGQKVVQDAGLTASGLHVFDNGADDCFTLFVWCLHCRG